MPLIMVQLNQHEPFHARLREREESLEAAKRALCRRYGWRGVQLGPTSYGKNKGGGETWPITAIKRHDNWDSTGIDPDTLAWWDARPGGDACMMDQKAAATLIRDANRLLGRDTLESLLPRPLHLSVCAHDTGCQPSIEARGDGIPRLLIWQASVWYSACYTFNDKDKVLGIQPDCEWAEPIIDRFLTSIQERMATHQTETAIACACRRVARDRSRAEAIAAYRRLFDL